MKKSGQLRDPAGRVWARFKNAHESYGSIVGECEILEMPKGAQDTFKQHEEMAIQQLLGHIDKVEEKIAAFGLLLVWDGETEALQIRDVQIGDSIVAFRMDPGPRTVSLMIIGKNPQSHGYVVGVDSVTLTPEKNR